MKILDLYHKLTDAGVLGINNRNLHYIAEYNERRLYPLVDDKYKTKQLAIKAGVAVPELYGMIETQRQIRDLPDMVDGKPGFAVKPSQGSGGSGVVVISGKAKNGWRKPSGDIISEEELNYHISLILSGVFSLGGHPDKALVEYRINPDPIFSDISYVGVPDIRIIVFFGIPVMSMMRLPTRVSGGRANLHQGAIGAGIDISKGETVCGVCKNEIITEHPDKGTPIVGVQIPHWDELLLLASRCYNLTGLGYQGVDIVLDENFGPLLLELNARPGLNIQIANGTGALKRLKKAEAVYKDLKTPEERVAFAREEFAA